MSNISKLYQDDEDRFEEFVKHGSNRILGNREFCGLTISDFVDFVVDGDLSGKMLNGLVRSLVTGTYQGSASVYQKHFNELFDRFISANEKRFQQEFARLQLEAKAEAETAHITFNNVSNF